MDLPAAPLLIDELCEVVSTALMGHIGPYKNCLPVIRDQVMFTKMRDKSFQRTETPRAAVLPGAPPVFEPLEHRLLPAANERTLANEVFKAINELGA